MRIFFSYKYPSAFSFFPLNKFWLPSPLPLSFFYCVCRSIPLDRPPWRPRSRSGPKDSDPAPPRGRHYLLRKIHTNSFPRRPSGSITIRCSTTRFSRNAVSPPSMHSSTSLSRTVAGRRFRHPLLLKWPRSCGSSTPICLLRLAPPSSSEESRSSLVPRPVTRSTTCWMTIVRSIGRYLLTQTMST